MENNDYYQNKDFRHGFTIGVENARKNIEKDEDPYEAYLSSDVHFEWLKERISEKKESIAQIGNEISETKNTQKTSFEQLQTYTMNIGTFSRKVAFAQNQVDDIKQNIQNLQNKQQKLESEYSFFAGFLYLLAGLAFVCGDLIISHEIVAYALNIKGNFESWAFAIGLAMLSILLKPIYERLVEQPYLKESSTKSKKVYLVFQSILLTFSLMTLLILGFFRYEAYKTDKIKDNINRQIENIQSSSEEQSIGLENNKNQSLIDTQIAKQNQLTLLLVESRWAEFSFVLSGILFAVAGAICLGIALPIMQSFWHKWLQASPKIKQLDKQMKLAIDNLQLAEEALATQIAQKNILENQLQILPNTQELEQKREEIIEEINDLYERLKVADQDRRINTFSDGVEKGKANRAEMTDEEYEELRSSLMKQVGGNQEKEDVNAAYKQFRRKTLSPHQAIRKVIIEQFNQN